MNEASGSLRVSILERLLNGQDLSEPEAFELSVSLAGQEIDPALGGAILAGLRAKGETAEEVRGFARGMRSLARAPGFAVPADACDIVGTGGDGMQTYNLSTGAAILAAAAGVSVVKHGNRSVSSRSGAADLLEAIGLSMPPDVKRMREVFESVGFAFLFAPAHHPAAANVAPVRKSMGVRTIFNIIGPLTNPASPAYGVIGAYSEPAAALMADAISGMEIDRVFVVHGEPGCDEATPAGVFTLYEVNRGSVRKERRDPLDLGVPRCGIDELRGGDAEENASALRRVFEGERGAHRDALCLAAGLAIEVCGVESDAESAYRRACCAIDDGAARRVLDAIGGVSGG